MLGIVLLQQMEDLADEEAVRQFAFNIMWHYALNVTDPSDFSSYVSPRTLWTMRDLVGRLGFLEPLHQHKAVVANLLERPGRLARLDGELTVVFLLVAAGHLAEGLVEVGMMTLEVDQELPDGFDEQPGPPQMGHVGEDVHRVQPLLGGVEVKEPLQRVGDVLKERLLAMKSIRNMLKGLTHGDLEVLKRIEDLEDLRAAEAALADPENRKRVPWEEVKKALKL